VRLSGRRWSRCWALRCLGVLLGVAGLLAVGLPATAAPLLLHAELVSTSPADGARLEQPPSVVSLRFSEPVSVVGGGLRIEPADPATGPTVAVGRPAVRGDVVRWPVTGRLSQGTYVVRWRVVSDDGHPEAGAFAFGLGVQPRPLPSTAAAAGRSWPVVLTRWLADLSFAVVAGVIAFTLWCRRDLLEWSRGRRLLLGGLVAGLAAGVLGLLLQGPYAGGVASYRLFDRTLMAEVAHTSFGAWMQLRVYLYLAMTAVLWGRGALDSALNRWIAVLGTLALAVTFSGTGHAASSGQPVDRVVITLHVLSAGVWVGGLLTIVVLSAGRRDCPGLDAYLRFSQVALAAVALLLVTGALNALLRLGSLGDLASSGYGRLLVLKALLVLAALAAAVASRRLVRRGESPLREVRWELAATTEVLAASAVLALTAPPGT
jgi:copper transport protein